MEGENNMGLEKYTLQELLNEIEKRKTVEKSPKLIPNEKRDYSKLEICCENYLDEVSNPWVKELGHYIFEEALIALYGNDIFDFINSKLE